MAYLHMPLEVRSGATQRSRNAVRGMMCAEQSRTVGSAVRSAIFVASYRDKGSFALC